jgi:hypothetical protein
VVHDADGTLQVFVVGTNGQLWHAFETGVNGTWSSWYPIGVNPVAGTQVSAVLEPNGAVDVYFEAANDCVWHTWETTAGQPGNYSYAPLNTACGETSDPAAAIQPNGQAVVYFRGANGEIWESHDTGSNNYGTWARPLPIPMTTQAGTDVSVVKNGPGELTVFCTAANNAVWWAQENGVNNVGSYVGSYPLPTANERAGAGKSNTPVAAVNQDGHMEVFFTGPNHSLWHSIETGSGTNAYLNPYPLSPPHPQTTGMFPASTLNYDGRLVVLMASTETWIDSESSPNSSGVYSQWQMVG